MKSSRFILVLCCIFLNFACSSDGFRSSESAVGLSVSPIVPPPPPPPPTDDLTYYIRPDGGDTSECNGKTNASYSGSGLNQNCAWKHPFYAFPPNTTDQNPEGTANIPRGSTLIIARGNYMMGYGATNTTNCNTSWTYACKPSAVPSGLSSHQPTRILGEGYDRGCTSAPKLWGTQRAGHVFNLISSSHVEVACLEITDNQACVENHCHGGNCQGVVARCERNNFPYGEWASTGITARDSDQVKLTDVNIHGLANKGLHIGRISNWFMERVKINGNGWVGWDGDVGANNSSNNGVISFKDSEISWNGCVQNQDGTHTGCWGQQSGGYGDGLGTHETSGNWIFENVKVMNNASDGIDLLYMNGGSVNVKHSYFKGNAGNQLKTKAGGLIENNVIIGDCSFFNNNPGHNLSGGDHCRALGNTVSVGLLSGHTVTLKHNTITGEGDCLILSGGGDSSSHLNVYNNILHGQTDWRQPFEKTCGHYQDGGGHQTSFVNNIMYELKNSACYGGNLCNNPLLQNMQLSSYNPTPLPGSPAVDAASMLYSTALDFNYRTRPRGLASDIGALEN